MLKASAGGGGKGMRAVWKPEKLKEARDSARQESKAAFGNDDMYMEKLIEEPRHIEIQIVGDSTGRACHLSERDCSVQRRHQKLTEETPSPFMTDELREKMGLAAVKAAEYIKYEGAGTIEFLVDKHRNFYFMEMNTRIQVEHPVTNAATGVDLLRAQILHAFGAPIILKQEEVGSMGHSIEARITNLDPYDKNFGPMGGNKIDRYWRPERTDRIRHYGYMTSGNTVTSFDPMFAKVIGRGHDRNEAIEALFRGLSEFIIEGPQFRHNIPHQLFVISHPKFINHDYNSETMDIIRTDFLERFVPFFDTNYGKENRYNNPIVADAVNDYFGHHFH